MGTELSGWAKIIPMDQELDVESLRYRVGAFVVVCVVRLLMSEENQRRFVRYL